MITENEYISKKEIKITIKEQLEEGKEKSNYTIDYQNEEKILNIYSEKTNVFLNKETMNKLVNLKSELGDFFYIPIDEVNVDEYSVGYIFDNTLRDYMSFTKVLEMSKSPYDLKTAIDICMKLCLALYKLHEQDLYFQTWNPLDLMINIQTGDLKILIDNVSKMNFVGDYIKRYSAPERGEQGVSKQTDLYSLGLFIYLILTLSHPLEGRKALRPVINESVENELYVNNPLFIYSTDCEDNRPVKYIQQNAINSWLKIPDFFKRIIGEQFSHRLLIEKPENRYNESSWLVCLEKLRGTIIRCQSCKNDNYVEKDEFICTNCRKQLVKRKLLQIDDNNLKINLDPGNKVYKGLLEISNPEEMLKELLVVVYDRKANTCLKNLNESPIKAYRTSGKFKTIKHGSYIPVIPGIRIEIMDFNLSIEEE